MATKKTARQVTEKQLERALETLDKAAAYFESRGFETQRHLLDKAAERVEDVRDSLASL